MDRKELSARHFTDPAQRVVQHIADRALDRGMIAGELTEATAGMLAVLSILRWERKVGLAALERLGADLGRFAADLDTAIDVEGESSVHADGPQFGALPSGQRCVFVDTDAPRRPLLGQAERESLALGHNWVGTEHLLLAAVRFAAPRFREILERHVISYDKAREAVLEVLRPS